MTCPSVVRLATVDDAPGVLKFCHMMHEEHGFASMNEHKVMMMIARGVCQEGAIIGVIGEDPNNLEGVIALVLDELWYTDDPHLSELYNFVHPDHRKSGHAKALIEFAKKCSRDLEIPLIIGVFSNHRTEAKVRLYRRQFTGPAGAFFIYGKGAAEAHQRNAQTAKAA